MCVLVLVYADVHKRACLGFYCELMYSLLGHLGDECSGRMGDRWLSGPSNARY